MRKISFILSVLFCLTGQSQDLYNNIQLTVNGTASLFIADQFTNQTSATYVNNATVTIKGDITNNQTTAMTGTGITNVTGTAAQQFLGNQTFFTNNLLLSNTSAGTSNFVFNGSNSFTVGTAATFTDGIVVTNNNNLIFNNSATYSGASNTSHVNGFVRKIGNQSFVFPVGDGTTLRTAAIAAPSLATDAFTGKYIQANPNTASFNPASKQAVLDFVSTCEYWTINRTTGASNVAVTLSWLNSSPYNCLGTVAPTDYYTARWDIDSTKWISHGNGSTTGTSASGTITTNTLPTVYGPFTLAIRNIPLPIVLNYFKGNVTNEGNLLSWEISVEENTTQYSVERSCDGTNWKTVGFVPVKNSTHAVKDYSLLDPEPCDGLSYYKLVEFSGNNIREEYAVISLFNEKALQANFQIFPNPNNGSFSVYIKGEDKYVYQMEMVDVLGKQMNQHLLQNGLNIIECHDLAAGIYLAQFKLGKEQITRKIVIN